MESPVEGYTLNSGRGRVALSTVILAQRGSPMEGLGSALSLPWWNHRWDSSPAAQALNDSIFSVCHRYPGGTNRGIASSQSPLDSASALRRKLLSLPCSSFSAAIRFAGFASEAWAAERENDSRA